MLLYSLIRSFRTGQLLAPYHPCTYPMKTFDLVDRSRLIRSSVVRLPSAAGDRALAYNSVLYCVQEAPIQRRLVIKRKTNACTPFSQSIMLVLLIYGQHVPIECETNHVLKNTQCFKEKYRTYFVIFYFMTLIYISHIFRTINL